MQILETLIIVWVNTYYGQSLVIQEQVDSHRVGCVIWVYGVVVSMFDFHRSDRGSNPGRSDKIS